MPADLPANCRAYVLGEHERFPTLTLDDGMWRGDPMGSEPAGHYLDEVDRLIILPDAVYELWQKATNDLAVIEDMIREIAAAQARFAAVPHTAPEPVWQPETAADDLGEV